MTWELSQTFLFDANADDVVAYILDDINWKANGNLRTLEVIDGQFILRIWLSAVPAPRAIYSIGIVGGTRAGKSFYDEKAHSILSATSDIGEIALRQSKAGECLAELYLESDPRRLGSDHTSLWNVTPQLVGIFWNRLINDWLQREKTKADTFIAGSSSAVDNVPSHNSYIDLPSELMEQIIIKWSVSELKRWVDDYKADRDLQAGFFQLADGTIQINQEFAGGVHGAMISFIGQPMGNGQIELTPTLNEIAKTQSAAIDDLRQWREALVKSGETPVESNLSPAENQAKYVYMSGEAGAGADADGKSWGLEPGLPGTFYPMGLKVQENPENIRSHKKLPKRQNKRKARWQRILNEYMPKGLTQQDIADQEDLAIETIKDDYRDMRIDGLLK